jgi:hypothetical protein
MSVNKERVKLLCRTLESGEFSQTAGVLRRPGDGHCCLGVATEVALRSGLQISTEDVWDHGEGEVLHPEVLDWYGFDDEDPTIIVIGEQGERIFISATVANDAIGCGGGGRHQYSFSDISAGFHRMYLEENQ